MRTPLMKTQLLLLAGAVTGLQTGLPSPVLSRVVPRAAAAPRLTAAEGTAEGDAQAQAKAAAQPYGRAKAAAEPTGGIAASGLDGLLQSRRPLGRKQLKEPAYQWLLRELRWTAQEFVLLVEEESLGYLTMAEEREMLRTARERFSVGALQTHLEVRGRHRCCLLPPSLPAPPPVRPRRDLRRRASPRRRRDAPPRRASRWRLRTRRPCGRSSRTACRLGWSSAPQVSTARGSPPRAHTQTAGAPCAAHPARRHDSCAWPRAACAGAADWQDDLEWSLLKSLNKNLTCAMGPPLARTATATHAFGPHRGTGGAV